MKKYKVYADIVVFYDEVVIEAESEEDVVGIYWQMVNNGKIKSWGSEGSNFNCEEIEYIPTGKKNKIKK